jgi:UDP-N-acetylglucosamine--N-acetylmuramyl-(pentapeptide) pyrophosphoryl-undecaprenol N-acetylglucosamine transferase
MRILFAGGGTAGHIFPIIAICREIKKLYPELSFSFFYFGPKDKFSKILLSQEGIKVKTIFSGKIRRYFGFKSFFQNIIDIFKIPLGIFQAFLYIFFLAPDLIFSKGGYGSLPTVISGWLLGVPIFLHESDAVAGLTNRLLSKFSLEIFTSFPIEKTESLNISKMISVGNPIRKEILEGDKKIAKSIFNLTFEKPIVLILGGSQGAQRINEVILQILPELLKNFEIIHQCGKENFKEVKAGSELFSPKELKKYYHLFPFLEEKELKHAYKACDIIVSRAGSGTIFEIAALGKPSILIPLPEAAQDHQLKNAYAFAKEGAAMVIEKANFTPHFFLERLKFLASNYFEQERMKEKALEFSRPEAAKIIADYLVSYLTM